MDTFAHSLDTKARHLLSGYTEAVIMHFETQTAVLLAEGDAHFTGAGVFADVIE